MAVFFLAALLTFVLLITSVHASDDCSSTDLDWQLIEGSRVGNQPSSLQSQVIFEIHNGNLTRRTGPYPGSRSAAAVWADSTGQVWLFGGRGFNNQSSETAVLLNDLWTHDPSVGSWQQVSNNADQGPLPTAREGAWLCGVHGLVLVLHGGQGLTDSWLYDLQVASWLPLPGQDLPGNTMAAWCLHDRLIALCEASQHKEAGVWALSLRDLKWTLLVAKPLHKSSAVQYPLSRHGAATWHHKAALYMYGGAYTDSHQAKQRDLCVLWMFSLHNHTFSAVSQSKATKEDSCATAFPTPNAYSSTWVDPSGHLWMFGGQSTVAGPSLHISSEAWCYSLQTAQWRRSNLSWSGDLANYPSPRTASQVWQHAATVYLFGGLGIDARNKTCYLNDLWALSNATSTLLAAARAWFNRLPPASIFLLCLATFGGIVFTFGTCFCIKKMLEHPNHDTGDFTVKYSPLSQEAVIDM